MSLCWCSDCSVSPPPIGLLSTVYWSTIRLLNPEDCRGKDGRKDYFIHLLLIYILQSLYRILIYFNICYEVCGYDMNWHVPVLESVPMCGPQRYVNIITSTGLNKISQIFSFNINYVRGEQLNVELGLPSWISTADCRINCAGKPYFGMSSI